ncbi:MAG: peptidoglycan DD-metalloendopeptidase family protein [Muribaculaceae bacterium]|nr:peptidoglycan DD-metalloendopeptidase family protein [Muribaculaceae bacterium]
MGNSKGTQKKSGSAQKKTTSNKENSSGQKKSNLNQKKVTSSQKKSASSQKKSSQTQKKGSAQVKKQASGSPQSSAEAKRMHEAAQREIQQTKEKLRLNEQEIKRGLSDLNRLSAEISTGRAKVQGLQNKVASLNKEITTLGEEISKNETELKLMRDEYLKAVKKMRLTKKNQSTLAFIFASENFNQAMRRIRYMRQFSAWKEKKSADIDNKIKLLDGERKRLADVKDAQTVALGQLTESQAQLEENHHKQESLVAKLRQNGDALQAHLVAKQNEANRLKETISALIVREQEKAEAERKAREKAEAERLAKEKAEAERKAAEKAAAEKAAAEKAAKEKKEAEKKSEEKASAKKTETETKKTEKDRKKNSEKSARTKSDRKKREEDNVKQPSKNIESVPPEAPKAVEKSKATESYSNVNFASLRGSLPRPVEGSWRITNPFGRHSMPELPEIEYDNPGIDAEVAMGANVKSVCGGKVSGVYKVAGYGTVVIVNHGDYYTVYGNLASTNVSVGTSVGAGQTLGTAGTDPDDHRRGSVHFEVWKGREKQNPSSWLR